MANDAHELYDLTFSPQYEESLDEICRRTGISIHAQYDEAIFRFDKGRVVTSGVSPHDIESLVATRDRRFIDFCVAKIQRFEKQDAKQDFPKGEEVETFDQKERALGFSRGILLMYSIEFLLGLEGPQRLEAYVKKARIPSAKKYVKDVVDLIERST